MSPTHGIVVAAAVVVSLWASPGLAGMLGGALAAVMVAIAVIDARYFIIPDKLILTGIALGLLYAFVDQPQAPAEAIASSALRGIVTALIFWGLLKTYEWVRGREGMGLGDVKLALVAGLWLDWFTIAVAVEFAALAALAVVGVRALQGARITATTALPFGAFFAPAIWFAWLLEVSVLQALF